MKDYHQNLRRFFTVALDKEREGLLHGDPPTAFVLIPVLQNSLIEFVSRTSVLGKWTAKE
jgi:hypothetical protein